MTCTGAAHALNDPPSQVGRLAYTGGTVSFHDDEQTGWSPAVINTPLTSGDSIWTEPGARSEISVAGTRVRGMGDFMIIQVICLAIVIFFPDIVLWLPRSLK